MVDNCETNMKFFESLDKYAEVCYNEYTRSSKGLNSFDICILRKVTHMKKLLSVFLILCMLGASFVLLTSCGNKGISEKDLKKNTDEVLIKAYQNTTDDFFDYGSENIDKVFEKAMQKGSLNITFASDLLMGGTLTKVSETVYMDQKAQSVASDTLLKLDGTESHISIYGNKDQLTIGGKDLLGTDTTYALNFKTFAEKLKGSALAKMMGMTDEDVDDVVKYMESMTKTDEELKKKAEQLTADIYALMNRTVSTEEVEIEEGKTAKYLVVSHTVNNDNIKAIFDKIMDFYSTSGLLDKEDLKDMIDGLTESLGQINMDVDLASKVYLDAKSAKVVKTTFGGKIVNKNSFAEGTGDPEEISVDATVTFSDTEIALKLNADVVGEKVSANVSIKKEQEKDLTTYTLTANAGTKGVSIDLLTGTFSYNKKTGDAKLTAQLGDFIKSSIGMMGDAIPELKLTVNAKCTAGKDEASIKFQNVTFAGVTYTFDGENEFSITAKVLKEIPAMPADTKDIMDLTESDWAKLGESIEGTELFKALYELISNIGDTPVMPEMHIECKEIGDELLLGIGEDYTETKLEGYAAAYETDEAAILVLRESKEDCQSAGISSLDDYIAAVVKNSNGISESDVQEHEGVAYFEYVSSGFGYMAAMYETNDAYWLINYAGPEESYDDEYRDTFLFYLEWLCALDMED